MFHLKLKKNVYFFISFPDEDRRGHLFGIYFPWGQNRLRKYDPDLGREANDVAQRYADQGEKVPECFTIKIACLRSFLYFYVPS